MTIQARDWEKEQARLKVILERINEEVDKLSGIVEHRGTDVLEFGRNFWDEVTVNTTTYDEIAETAASITQQQNLMNQEVRSFRHAESSLRKLLKLLASPYFARIDFREAGESQSEAIYIGIGSLVDEETHELLVYDWRAPISGMFYDYTPGAARYSTPSGTIEGEITLKRQYIIKHGELENMFDTGINIGDEMLQVLYAKSSQEKMSSIVTTIQQEQNQIIRDDEHEILIVQGAAGSGKTSVALQRVAYLLYKYRNSLTSDNMVLFSPNSIFNDYVSNVLPELGETNMLQTTFQEYIERGFGKGLTVEDAYDQLEYLLTAADSDVAYRVRVNGIEWKTSLSFLELLNRYSELLKKEGVLFQSFSLKGRILISAARIHDLFYNQFAHDPSISSRIDKIKSWIVEELGNYEEKLFRRNFQRMIRDPRYLGTDKEMKAESRKRARAAFAPLYEQARELAYVDILGMYCRLFTDPSWIKKIMGNQIQRQVQYEEIGSYTLTKIMSGVIPYEDATPILFMRALFEGTQSFNQIKQVIIDEAQDYSPFQLEYIRRLFPRGRFTLLGDLNQGIYHANVQSYEMMEQLFNREVGIYRIAKSYRSTKEIIDFTKQILRNPEPIEAIERHGEVPRLISVETENEHVQVISKSLDELFIQQGLSSIAVICKTEQETVHAFDLLKPLVNFPLHLMTKNSRKFTSGVVIIPSYLAKGLEFEAVIIYNAGEEIYYRESERKLLYTACTRAMHHLQVYYTGKLTPLIQLSVKGTA